MPLKKWFAVFVFLIIFSNLRAQSLELAKVSLAELQEKAHPKDTSAVAAVLFKKGKTVFGFNVKNGFTAVHECQIRIKIYKKEGLNWSNFVVPYYVGYEDMNDDIVKFSNGVTYNLENGAIVKTKLNSEGSFKKNVNEYWNEASIALPNVKVGSVIEFKYVLKSENIVKFPVFDIQYDIPVNFMEYKTELPENFIYKTLESGYVKIKSELKYGAGSIAYEGEYIPGGGGNINILTFNKIISIYSAVNIPALNEEPYLDNIKNYKSSIRNELERIRYPDKPDKDYSITWEGVAKTIFENKDFGKELDERLYLLEDLKKILKKNQNIDFTEAEKLDIIFNFVKQKMNWSGEYGYYADKGVKKAYLDQTGNTAEINFILIDMLKLAGISANPVLVSTVEHGIPVFPNRTVFNYVIVAAEVNGKQILLDATDKYTTQNILPLKVLNWKGRLIEKDGTSQEINLVPMHLSNKNYTLMTTVDSEGIISGKIRVQKTDFEAYSFREKYGQTNKEDYLEKLENDLNGIEITDYLIENKDTNFSKPVIETFTFKSDNCCEIIANKMFINPMLFFTINKNPFVQEKRQMPIYFGYPIQGKYAINVQIPAGFKVETLPSAMNISMQDNLANFKFMTSLVGNTIQISIVNQMNTPIVSAEYYSTLKEYFQKVIEKQNEKIVLIKI
ncbi:hypothetical protein IWX84_002991 [Flavobacterium sp. CG_9.10]|uniref:DUF3857 domain-containing protein n=1 Tax=Flavobacterium sp. CG_9.10 TaxID=2787729 RepID=UPI0018CBD359|nr:DUF3857 domain-containing protein [Flavobacterium sp. CG_9.10]MBG6112095.1 hypothetical protein [Flavobacterium sp. CG_9.10]